MILAYETDKSWVPDPQYVNDPLQDQEYYAWVIGGNEKYNLWTFTPAVSAPTQDLVGDILPPEYVVYEVNDDLQKYGHQRRFLLSEPISVVEEFFNTTDEIIESLY